MVEVGLTIRIAAALVFGWASVEKARQRVRFARSVEKHGIPNLISGAFGTSIIIAEAAVSAILLASVFLPGLSQIAAIGSGVLSIGFVGFVVHAIRTSVQEPCFCFGIQETRPANTSTLVRAENGLASPPAATICAATFSDDRLWLPTTTLAPSRAYSVAQAAPMPDPAPLMRMTLSSRRPTQIFPVLYHWMLQARVVERQERPVSAALLRPRRIRDQQLADPDQIAVARFDPQLRAGPIP